MCKSERFLTVLREHIIFNVKWVDIRKTSEVFWSKLYCKMSDIFRYFLLALRLSTWKSENLKKSLMTSTGTCGRIKKYTRNNIFKKRIPNMRFWIIYILVRVSFLGTVLRRFSQCLFFQFFVVGQPWWSTFLISPLHPTMKKLPTVL